MLANALAPCLKVKTLNLHHSLSCRPLPATQRICMDISAACRTLQVLLGFFEVTEEAGVPTTVVNPGARARATRRVWNDGQSGVKLLTLAPARS